MYVGVRIGGGTGNQLFQFAAAYALSLKYGARVLKDIRFYTENPGVSYDLPALGIRLASLDRAQRPPTRRESGIGYLLCKAFDHPARHITEDKLKVNKRFFKTTRKNIYLDGYFQNEAYFSEYGQEIRDRITLPLPALGLPGHGADHAFAAVHVRRGDYVKIDYFRDLMGELKAAYYRTALEMLQGTTHKKLIPVIFTNDRTWALENIAPHLPGAIVPDRSSEDPQAARKKPENRAALDDLALMASMPFHIIANSTFSWWGAWLSGAPGQQIAYPQPWFSRADMQPLEVACKHWTPVSRFEDQAPPLVCRRASILRK